MSAIVTVCCQSNAGSSAIIMDYLQPKGNLQKLGSVCGDAPAIQIKTLVEFSLAIIGL